MKADARSRGGGNQRADARRRTVAAEALAQQQHGLRAVDRREAGDQRLEDRQLAIGRGARGLEGVDLGEALRRLHGAGNRGRRLEVGCGRQPRVRAFDRLQQLAAIGQQTVARQLAVDDDTAAIAGPELIGEQAAGGALQALQAAGGQMLVVEDDDEHARRRLCAATTNAPGTSAIADSRAVTAAWYSRCPDGVTMKLSSSTAADLDLLRDLNQAYLDSVRTGDVERFRQLLADDFQCSTPAGELLDKTQFLARTAGPRTLERLDGRRRPHPHPGRRRDHPRRDATRRSPARRAAAATPTTGRSGTAPGSASPRT